MKGNLVILALGPNQSNLYTTKDMPQVDADQSAYK